MTARPILLSLSAVVLLAQNPASDQAPAAAREPPSSTPEREGRIFGVLPNFLTTEDAGKIKPLTPREKFVLVARQTYDPITILSAAAGAGMSQAQNGDPHYGVGGLAYAERFGAAMADLSSQSFFSGAVLASVLREDPRYFREGPSYGFWRRVGYSMSRVVVTRTDAGGRSFNFAGIVGMSLGIALSNAYYPAASVSARETGERFGTSLLSATFSNILPEFWPDIRHKLFHRKPQSSTSSPSRKP